MSETGSMMVDTMTLVTQSREILLRGNQLFEDFFRAETPRLAEACHRMSRRFLEGGRLLAFGRGPAATDVQHVSVEFVHPVLWGNGRCRRWISARHSKPRCR